MSKAVQIITPEETLILRIGESSFFYRRIRAAEKNNIILKHTQRGQINQTTATLEILRLCVKGWEEVKNGTGEDVPFSAELIEALPETVLMQLEIAVVSAYGEAFLKN